MNGLKFNINIYTKVAKSKLDARSRGVIVPETLEDYCIQSNRRNSSGLSDI